MEVPEVCGVLEAGRCSRPDHIKVPCAPPASCLELAFNSTTLASMLLKRRPSKWPSNRAHVYGASPPGRLAYIRELTVSLTRWVFIVSIGQRRKLRVREAKQIHQDPEVAKWQNLESCASPAFPTTPRPSKRWCFCRDQNGC